VPRRALSESSRRTTGVRPLIILVLAAWAVFAVLLLAMVAWLPEVIGRNLAPQLAESLGSLLLFMTVLALFWGALGVVAGIVNAALFALAIVRLYLHAGDPRPQLPASTAFDRTYPRMSRSALVSAVIVLLLAAVGFALLVAVTTRRNQQVLVIAHRGSSATAPENTLAAFRLAVEQGADFIEFDVQESSDSEVVVMHDSDLMRVGGSPLRVWEAGAEALRAVDVGSRTAARFSAERVPTLAETLAACKGGSRVVVELKSYRHAQRLEEKVVDIVEAARMEQDSSFMSLDHDMVREDQTAPALLAGWRTRGQGDWRSHLASSRFPGRRGAARDARVRAAGASRGTGRLRLDGQRPPHGCLRP
jgi:glycerophosphoryl diester phosphodiesterase